MLKNLSLFTDLIKYKLSLAVVFSSVAGYYLYDNSINQHFIFLVFGVFFLASGSAVLNQYTERREDLIMERTKDRPIPSKKISKRKALLVSTLLLLAGSIILYNNGFTPFLIGIFTVVLYNFIYTNLKKSTFLSIIPGAIVGALPPMIGYSSAGGTLQNHNIIAFSLFMFLWQLPHFWLIIIKYANDYKEAGFITISKYLNEIQIKYLVFFWVIATSFLVFLFFMYTHAINKLVLILITLLNLSFILLFYKLIFGEKGTHDIKKAFILINSFSLLLMLIIVAASLLMGS
jgi:heme o synthase